jgi:trimethylamine--corrinoid protein Co-methyltransferase
VQPRARPLVLAQEVLEHTTKPFFASVAGRDGARDALDLVEIACGGLAHPVAVGLINIDSPLRLNREMTEAMREYVTRGQPVVFTPGILSGATAPVTVTGALVQGFAEILGCATAVQLLHPGAPVVFGLGGFGADLRTVSPGFGRPENASAAYAGAQIARRLGVPFRCSASATGSCLPGFRAAQESMMTASAAWSAGAHLTMQALGILDHINAMSFEKFVLDAEGWRKLRHIARTTGAVDDADYPSIIAEAGGDYLTADHTVEHLHVAQHEALVRESDSCGGPGTHVEAVGLAADYRRRICDAPREPVLDDSLRQELGRFVASRLAELG